MKVYNTSLFIYTYEVNGKFERLKHFIVHEFLQALLFLPYLSHDGFGISRLDIDGSIRPSITY